MLFNAYSSAFNTVVSSKLIITLGALGLNPALCNWALDFLTGRTQVVKVGNPIESILSSCVTAWYGNCTAAHNRKAFQRVVRSAQRNTWGKLPAPLETYSTDSIGRPKRSSRTSTIGATACSPHYHPEGEVSTCPSKLGPRD
jgi:hypothetical protein